MQIQKRKEIENKKPAEGCEYKPADLKYENACRP